MKTSAKLVAQGDVLFCRVERLPDGLQRQEREGGKLIVAHSETGHHHSILDVAVEGWHDPKDSLVAYLRFAGPLEAGGAVVSHERSYDTHEPVCLLGEAGAVWQVRRQREWTPEGWRRVED